MISEELFSEVMDYDGDYQQYNTEQIMNDDFTFSLNDVAYECKEWALKQGYQFKIYIHTDGEEVYDVGKEGFGWDDYRAKSMIEACQWILENRR